MHIVNRIPLLFIGEGIKLYLCFVILVTNPYILGKADAKNVFIMFCLLFMYNSGHWHWHFTTFLQSQLPTNKQFSLINGMDGKRRLFVWKVDTTS